MTETVVDVCVIGGGPAGCFAAFHLARAGFDVLVLEEHAVIGEPVDCSGIIGTEAFEALGLPRSSVVQELRDIELVSPAGIRITFCPQRILAYMVDRGAFDRSVAELAVGAGARVQTRTSVRELQVHRDKIVAKLKHVGTGVEHVLQARAAILAGGPRYQFQQQLGLGHPRRYLKTAQAEVMVAKAERPAAFFGRGIAPGSFAWFLPVNDAGRWCAKIGVSTNADSPLSFRQFVSRLQEEGYLCSDGLLPRAWMIPIEPIPKTFGDRVVAVGDAAGQTKPTTGGGLYYGLLCAQLAAETLGTQLGVDRLAARDLAVYERRWRERLGPELRVASAFRHLVERLSDRDLDHLFRLARRDGFMRLIERRANFDWHRQLIAEVCRKPRFSMALFQGFLRSWLSA